MYNYIPSRALALIIDQNQAVAVIMVTVSLGYSPIQFSSYQRLSAYTVAVGSWGLYMEYIKQRVSHYYNRVLVGDSFVTQMYNDILMYDCCHNSYYVKPTLLSFPIPYT